MANYAALQAKKSQLIRKGLDGSVFLGPITAPEITNATLFDPTTGVLVATLPTGYKDGGWLTDDGAQYSRDVSQSDIGGWGSVEPLRSDTTQDTTTLKIAMEETNAQSIGLYVGVDASAVTPAVNGVITLKKPRIGNVNYHRVFTLAVDETDDGELYIVRFLPRARVTDYDDQAFANGDDPTLWSVTLTAFTDSALGYSESYLFGGPGWTAIVEDMGFPAVPDGG